MKRVLLSARTNGLSNETRLHDCAAPDALTGLETIYFSSFAGAQLLNVNVTTAKGQTQAQMTRDKPVLDLAGVM